MTVLHPSPGAPTTRRERAAAVAAAALRGGVLAAAVAAIAWALSSVIAGIAFLVLVVATLGAVIVTLLGRDLSGTVWVAIALAWGIVIAERAVVGDNGGVWVGGAAFAGVVIGARRAGIHRFALPLLAYPLLGVVILLAANQSLLHPWGISWLWVAAILGPPLGARTLLQPSAKRR